MTRAAFTPMVARRQADGAYLVFIGSATVPDFKVTGVRLEDVSRWNGCEEVVANVEYLIGRVARPRLHDVLAALRTSLEVQWAEHALEAEAEAYAEGAWLRAAEQGTAEDFAFEQYEREVEALGYGSPNGFY